jgi:SapB morphogen precursor RamS
MALLDLQGMEWKEEARGGDQTNLCVDVSDISVDISL